MICVAKIKNLPSYSKLSVLFLNIKSFLRENDPRLGFEKIQTLILADFLSNEMR